MKHKKYLEIIDNVVNGLEYERIHTAMEATGWHWVDTADTPSPEQIKRKAYVLAHDTVVEALRTGVRRLEAGTGGIYVRVELTKKGKLYLKVSFELTSWSNWE